MDHATHLIHTNHALNRNPCSEDLIHPLNNQGHCYINLKKLIWVILKSDHKSISKKRGLKYCIEPRDKINCTEPTTVSFTTRPARLKEGDVFMLFQSQLSHKDDCFFSISVIFFSFFFLPWWGELERGSVIF